MRHHYIPEFLLGTWARTTFDKKLEVFRLDLSNFPSNRRAPKATGYVNDLYALTQPAIGGVKQQDVETKFLQRLDSIAANVLRKLHESGLADLTRVQFSYGKSKSLI